MKTSAELQQQSFIRKMIYFGIIVVLFTAMTFSGSVARELSGGRWTRVSVNAQAEKLQLRETRLGQANVLGATARVTLTGSRGFAICLLWISAIEKQKRHEWNDLESLVNVITKLQPYFLTPWLFQSWNLSYNVSVESDRVKDKYFYIAKGIDLLAEGERINRARGVDDDGKEYEVGHPDMRYWVGFYYNNKFGSSDEQNALRSLLQLSLISPADRDHRKFRTANGRVAPDSPEFREFVKNHPMLCRRLRDFLRCSRPDDIVDFLHDNEKLPTRFEEIEGVWRLKNRVEEQFPVLPDSSLTVARANPRTELGDEFDNYHAAWAWMAFAQQPLPPYEYGKPAAGVPEFDSLRYRKNRQPMAIIFRQAPHRADTSIAERLQKEGWFDDSGWHVDEGRLDERWFPSENLVVGNNPRYSAQEAWKRAYAAWDRHGKEHGLSLEQNQIDNLDDRAKPFRLAYGVDRFMAAMELKEEQVEPHLRDALDAHHQWIYLQQNLQVTNYNHFKYEAQAESDDRVVAVRKLMFDAERLRRTGNIEPAIRKFRDAFERLCGSAGKRGLLEEFPNFRADTGAIELLYEKHLIYLRLLENYRGQAMRGSTTAAQLFGYGFRSAAAFDLAGAYTATLYQESSRPRELPSLFSTPMDGHDSQDLPWVLENTAMNIKLREGYIKAQPQAAPQAAPPEAGKNLSMPFPK